MSFWINWHDFRKRKILSVLKGDTFLPFYICVAHDRIVKHNLLGRVMGSAVLADDPNVALELLNNISEDSMFGNRSVYSNELLIETLSHDMKLSDSYGIRTFFGLSSNNEIKYTNEWYQSMLALEIKTSTMEEFKKIAFFNHLIFKKETNKQ